jgi:hypothetical protein
MTDGPLTPLAAAILGRLLAGAALGTAVVEGAAALGVPVDGAVTASTADVGWAGSSNVRRRCRGASSCSPNQTQKTSGELAKKTLQTPKPACAKQWARHGPS